FYKLAPADVTVFHDEIELPPGKVRVKVGGGVAGHNGLRSIKAHLHSDAFSRVRIGVGKPASKELGADHVLSGFSKRERAEIDVTLEQAADAVEVIAADGIEAAMNRFNGAATA
ncbi:MAG TPA: aminoacyl-tRNA hydrolase, partial [Acidimicrobiia bacterium]|nr:aminoacyl-tRNA hydrolase [Acidimicrobiia bacterium]